MLKVVFKISRNLFGVTPTYKVLSEEGPDHAKMFKVGVYLDKDLVATGEGMTQEPKPMLLKKQFWLKIGKVKQSLSSLVKKGMGCKKS